MPRIPPAVWLLGLALLVSTVTRPTARDRAAHRARAAAAAAVAPAALAEPIEPARMMAVPGPALARN